jgi:ribosome-associated translation inhibitor RaiA
MQARSNVLLNPSDEHFIDQQINRLSRHFTADNDLPIMDIVLTSTSTHPCINATVFLDDATLISHQEESTTRRALRVAFRDLSSQIRRWQADKQHRQTRRQNINSRQAVAF